MEVSPILDGGVLDLKPMEVSLGNITLVYKVNDYTIQSAGVALEVNLRITQARKHSRDPPWISNSGQTVPEVQNRGISGPTKKDLCPQNFFKKSN